MNGAAPTPSSQPGLTWPISVAQLITWGSIYYCFTLFIEPMEMELRLDRTTVSGALTVGLLVCGACSLFVGSLIDKGHARTIMTSGALLGGTLLAAWSYVETAFWLYAVWVAMGIALSATVYEPAFAVMVRAFGTNSRKGITAVTLFGGLATTIFIPLTHLLIDTYDWRTALLVLAAFNIFVTAPAYLFALRNDHEIKPRVAQTQSSREIVKGVMKTSSFWWLSIAFSTAYFAGAGLILHIIPMLSERGFTLDQAVYAAALYGPSMLVARIALGYLADNINIIAIGCLALCPVIFGLLFLELGPDTFLAIPIFVIALGAGNGILTLLKPMAVAQFYAPAIFGTINGAMTVPLYVLRAFAPAGLAFIWSFSNSYHTVIWFMIGLTLFSMAAFITGVMTCNTLPPIAASSAGLFPPEDSV